MTTKALQKKRRRLGTRRQRAQSRRAWELHFARAAVRRLVGVVRAMTILDEELSLEWEPGSPWPTVYSEFPRRALGKVTPTRPLRTPGVTVTMTVVSSGVYNFAVTRLRALEPV